MRGNTGSRIGRLGLVTCTGHQLEYWHHTRTGYRELMDININEEAGFWLTGMVSTVDKHQQQHK